MLQIEQWTNHFPIEQFHFIRAESLYKYPQLTLAKLVDRLQLPSAPDLPQSVLDGFNKRKADCDISRIFSDEEHLQLHNFYRTKNARLKEIVGFDFDRLRRRLTVGGRRL